MHVSMKYMLLVLIYYLLLAKQQITHNNIHSHGDTNNSSISNAAATHSAQYHGYTELHAQQSKISVASFKSILATRSSRHRSQTATKMRDMRLSYTHCN